MKLFYLFLLFLSFTIIFAADYVPWDLKGCYTYSATDWESAGTVPSLGGPHKCVQKCIEIGKPIFGIRTNTDYGTTSCYCSARLPIDTRAINQTRCPWSTKTLENDFCNSNPRTCAGSTASSVNSINTGAASEFNLDVSAVSITKRYVEQMPYRSSYTIKDDDDDYTTNGLWDMEVIHVTGTVGSYSISSCRGACFAVKGCTMTKVTGTTAAPTCQCGRRTSTAKVTTSGLGTSVKTGLICFTHAKKKHCYDRIANAWTETTDVSSSFTLAIISTEIEREIPDKTIEETHIKDFLAENGPANFEYSTSTGSELSHSVDVSITAGVGFEAGALFAKASASLEVSAGYGYSDTKSRETSFALSGEIPKGKSVAIWEVRKERYLRKTTVLSFQGKLTYGDDEFFIDQFIPLAGMTFVMSERITLNINGYEARYEIGSFPSKRESELENNVTKKNPPEPTFYPTHLYPSIKLVSKK